MKAPPEAVLGAPLIEAAQCDEIGPARIVVVDLGGEEFEDALGRLGRWRKKRGQCGVCWQEDDLGARDGLGRLGRGGNIPCLVFSIVTIKDVIIH
jgi:hypothetical protein